MKDWNWRSFMWGWGLCAAVAALTVSSLPAPIAVVSEDILPVPPTVICPDIPACELECPAMPALSCPDLPEPVCLCATKAEYAWQYYRPQE